MKNARPKKYYKYLPCSCPILFSRSDTSISTSMISKSFEMHSLIINPVNEFFYQSKWISVFYSSVTFWYFLSVFSHFLITFRSRIVTGRSVFELALASFGVQVRFQLSTNRFWCITTLDLSFSFSVFNF